jgi:hypothetical protein
MIWLSLQSRHCKGRLDQTTVAPQNRQGRPPPGPAGDEMILDFLVSRFTDLRSWLLWITCAV